MTRRELLNAASAKLRSQVRWYQLDYLLSIGKLDEPPRDGSGRFVYGQEHLDRLVEIIGGRQVEVAAQ